MSQPPCPTIAIAPSLDDYFRGPVSEALRDADVPASPATESYLVQLLTEFANPSPETRSTLSEPVTLLLHDAMKTAGSERFKKLQTLGDGVLYGIGFFGQVPASCDKKYFVHVGASAYGHAAAMLRAGGTASGPDVLQELAHGFERFADVLAYVADWVMAQGAKGQEGLVKLYERWLKTGSTVLRAELGHRGMMPLENPGGVH